MESVKKFFYNANLGRLAGYKDSEDMCAACKQRGGYHYTDRQGNSWCYPESERVRYPEPQYQTMFTYNIEESSNPNDNPNEAFKRGKYES